MLAARIEEGRVVWQPDHDLNQTTPAADEVTIRIAYAGVNRADVMQVAGAYPPPPGASAIPGLECSGVVTAIGDKVTDLAVGDKVCALLAAGGYAESVTVNAAQVLPLPSSWALERGAGWLETFATAYLNVFMLADLQPGDRVFAHAGASGVGSALLQLCKEQGTPIYVTAGSDEKCAFCRELGATEAINRHRQDYVEVLKEVGGVDVILNPVGGDSVERDQQVLKQDGRLVLIGLMGGRNGQVDFGRLLMKRQRLMGSTLRSLSSERKGAILSGLWQHFGEAFTAARVRPMIDRVVPAEKVNEALNYLQENRTQGKVVLKIAELD